MGCRPLAGTRRRGKSLEEDKRLEQELLADEKELSEHIMLVDLGRNDVGKASFFFLECLCPYGPSNPPKELVRMQIYPHMSVVNLTSGCLTPVGTNLRWRRRGLSA